jgi:hypothetical protein
MIKGFADPETERVLHVADVGQCVIDEYDRQKAWAPCAGPLVLSMSFAAIWI